MVPALCTFLYYSGYLVPRLRFLITVVVVFFITVVVRLIYVSALLWLPGTTSTSFNYSGCCLLYYSGCPPYLRFCITVVTRYYIYVSLLHWLPYLRFFITALNFLEPRLRFFITVVAWLAPFLVYTGCLVPPSRFFIVMVAWYVYVSLFLWLPGAMCTFPYRNGCLVCLCSFITAFNFLEPRLRFFITVVAWLATFLVYTGCLVPLPRFSIILVAWYVYVSLLLWLPGARSTFPYHSGCLVCLS